MQPCGNLCIHAVYTYIMKDACSQNTHTQAVYMKKMPTIEQNREENKWESEGWGTIDVARVCLFVCLYVSVLVQYHHCSPPPPPPPPPHPSSSSCYICGLMFILSRMSIIPNVSNAIFILRLHFEYNISNIKS